MSLSSFGVAPIAVNNYLWSVMKLIEPTLTQSKNDGTTIPFFPLSDSNSGKKSWEAKSYFIYDRMFKVMKDPFYPIKCEEIRYNLKAKAQDTFIWGSAVQQILDRQDDAGKDVNNWIRSNGGNAVYPVYFHSLRVFQVNSSLTSDSSNQRDFTTRPYYLTEFIVDMKYHYTKSLEEYL